MIKTKYNLSFNSVVAVTVSILAYSACACCVILLYYFFAMGEGCNRNHWFIIINAGACIVASMIAVIKKGKIYIFSYVF